MEYNKLVRDKIPEIIAAQGNSCIIRTLSKGEYLEALNAKLQEEVNEYLGSGDIEELADIEEVLRAILDVKNIPYVHFDTNRKLKAKTRGGFKKRTYLVSVSE
jgi:predicted house-cleaning noncanonical NTP pyrophosphatase (MazG superfamily)